MITPAPTIRTIERKPPQRRTRRRSVWRVVVWPLVKFLAIAVAILLLAQVVIGTVSRPLRLLKAESSEYKRIAAELKSLKKSNEKLERQLIYIRKPHGAAQEARKIGYVKPGEILLVLPPNATSFPKSTSPR